MSEGIPDEATVQPQLELARERLAQVLADLRQLLCDDVEAFPSREARRVFVESPEAASTLDDAALKALKADAAALGPDLSASLAEALAPEACWLRGAAPGEDRRSLDGIPGVHAALAQVTEATRGMLAARGLPIEAVAYRPPRYFVHGRYLPGLAENADVRIGDFRFQYEAPSEYRHVQAHHENGTIMEGVPASWDIDSTGFTLIPSTAVSWSDAKFIRFDRLKGVYFSRDWDEDVRKELLNSDGSLHDHPATVRFLDGETSDGFLIGNYREEAPRFYFFPKDQSGDTVYVLIERSSVKTVERKGKTR